MISRNLKIAFDFRIFVYQKFGGISRYYVALYNSFKLFHSIDSSIYCRGHRNFYLSENKESYIYLDISEKSSALLFFVKGINKLIETFYLFFLPPDIYHLTYYDVVPKFWSKTKFVVTVYDMIHELYPGQFTSKAIELKRKCIEKADLIICISENTKNDLIRILNIEASKIRVIYLGFGDFYNSNTLGVSLNLDKYILFVGQRDGYKNFQNLLISYSNSTSVNMDYRLVCFGGGKFSPQEIAKLANLDLSDRVIYIEGDDSMLKYIYSNASLFVYPSLYEGFGIPPLEAMACDTPVCCSNTSSMPEVVGSAAEFFDPNSIDEISKSISKVLTSKELRNKLIINGRERIKLFTWEMCAIDTHDAYKSIL